MIKWKRNLALLKGSGYDSTISLEVFTSPEDRLRSREKLRKLWSEI